MHFEGLLPSEGDANSYKMLQSVKHVERAIYTANLGLAPQQVPGSESVLRLPIPR
jgi:ribosome recycling factor